MADSDEYRLRLAAYERETAELQEQAKALEEEVVALRRRLQDAPKRVRTLEEKLLETKGQLQQAISQNERLTYTLREAREHIAALREEVDKLTQPPVGLRHVPGRQRRRHRRRVLRRPQDARGPPPRAGPRRGELQRGQEVVLNESLNVVLARGSESSGEVVDPQGACSRTGAGPSSSAGPTRSGWSSWPRRCRPSKLRAGDSLLMDSRTGLLLEKLPRPEVEELVLEEVPDISYDDVGGLDSQIEAITDAVELPFLHRELFLEHKLPAPKGILLYGPPGCGKTLIAKAVANSLAKKVARGLRRQGAAVLLPQHQGPRAAQQVRGRDRAPDPPGLPAGPGEERGGRARHRLLRRDGLAVPHPGHRHLARTWSRPSCPSCWPRSTASRP